MLLQSLEIEMLYQDYYFFLVYLLLINTLTAQGQFRSSAFFPPPIRALSNGLNGDVPHSE
jgi:hypothetical protein